MKQRICFVRATVRKLDALAALPPQKETKQIYIGNACSVVRLAKKQPMATKLQQ